MGVMGGGRNQKVIEEGRTEISLFGNKEFKVSFSSYRVTLKGSRENTSQVLLALDPKVTFKIPMHPSCIT